MKNLMTFMLLVAVCPYIYSQNKLSGHVNNAETGEPVISATVYIPEIEKGSMTDLDGNFSINQLPSGNFEIMVSLVGFKSYSAKINIPSEALEINLQPTAIEMEEVIVSTPFHQLQGENVMKVDRESVSDLHRKGAINLSDGISKMPGVESLTTGVGIGKPVIRGLSSNRVLVYTQGVRLENQQFGGEHGLGISSKGISSVEVIKGPASLLYGSDAIGGVLYLNPEAYASANSTEAELDADYFSNTRGTQLSGMAKTSGEKLKFLGRASYAAHSDYKTGDNQRVTNTRFEEKDLKAGIGYQGTNYKADLRYNFNRSNIGIPEEIGVQSTSKEMMLPYQKVDNHVLSLDNSLYLENSSFNLKLGYEFNNRKEFEEDSAPDPSLEMHLETLNYNLKYNLPEMGKFETIAGLQGMHQTNSNYGDEVLIPNATTNDIGAFATTHYHLESWDFQGGLRFDHRNIEGEANSTAGEEDYIAAINRSFNSVNGALGAKYEFKEKLTARLNLATGFRAPNLSELTSNGSHSGARRYEIGNSGLSNEQNFQTDLALEWKSKHFEAYANGFRNFIDNYIFLSPTGDIIAGNPAYKYTQSNASLYGGEIGLHLHPHPLDWLHLESSFETVTGKQDNGEFLPLIPANSITNTLRVEFNEGERLSDKFAFVSLKNVFDKNQVSKFETPTPGYGLLSAGLGGKFEFGNISAEFNLTANNILDKKYISHLSRLKPEGIPDIGRNLMASLQLHF